MDKSTLGFRKEHLFRILLLCFSTAVALLLGETILQLALPNAHYVWPPHIETVFEVNHDIAPGISGPSRFITNSRGMRAEELMPSHTDRILAIGGSTTECLYLDQPKSWPYLLQKALNENAKNDNIWVGNAGMSGRTTRHHLTAMRYLPLKEMQVDTIIVLVGVNDFSRRLSQDEHYDPNFLAKPEAPKILFSQTFTGGRYAGPDEPFFKKTAIWHMLRKVKRMARSDKNKVQDKAGKTLVTWRKHRRQATEIRNELPDLTSALDEYSRNINKIVDMAQEKSVRLILMTQPTLWKSGLSEELDALLWLGGIGDFQVESGKAYYSSEALEKGMRKYNDALLNICRKRQLECIDLSSILEKDTTVFYDDVHFNESGALKVSKILANYILSQ